MPRTRLCLVTPSPIPPGFSAELKAALAAGDVASVLIAPAGQGVDETVATVMSAGAAAILVGADDPGVADGIHIEADAKTLRSVRDRIGEGRIVGAGGIRARHDAMIAGEAMPDYLFFGRFDGDNDDAMHPKALELASWWAALFEIPAIVMGGSNPESAGEAAAAGVEFVALGKAVWDYPEGAATAVAIANRELDLKSLK